jgi:hypothetical protein
MFHQSLLPACPHKRRRDRLTRLRHAVGLDQKQFPIPQFEKRFAAFSIGTLTQHLQFTAFCSTKRHSLSDRISALSAIRMPDFSLAPTRDFFRFISARSVTGWCFLAEVSAALPISRRRHLFSCWHSVLNFCCILDFHICARHNFDVGDHKNICNE